MEDFFCCEMFGGNFARGAAVAFVIALDRINRDEDIFHRLEAEEAFAGRQVVSECSVLIDDRPACREIAGAAVAKPATAKANVLVFGDGEFAPGFEDEVTIAGGVAGEFDWICNTPLIAFEQLPRFVIDADRELERDGPAFREVENFFEFAIFRPVIGLAVVNHVFAFVAPGCDGVEGRAVCLVRVVFPQIQNNRLNSRQPTETVDRHATVGLAEISAIAEVRVMRLERGDGFFVSLGNFDLSRNGVSLDVDAASASHVFVPKFLSTGDVEETFRFAIQPQNVFFGHAVAAATGVVSAESPTVFEAVRFEDWNDGVEVIGSIRRQIVQSRVINPTAGILYVIRIVTEPSQADQEVQKLVCHTCEREPE